jgi:VanZ family protein
MTSRVPVRPVALALAVLWLGVIAIVTLGPTPWATRASVDGYDVLSLSTWLSRGTWAIVRTGEFLANVLLFVPLGMLVRLGLPRYTWVFAAFVGGVVSVGVEVLQMGSARVSDPRDVVANTLGALVGALGVAGVSAVVRGVRSAARGVRSLGGSLGGSLGSPAGSASPPQVGSPGLLVLSKVSSTGENGVRKD